MLRKLYMTGIERSSRSFSLPQAIENSRQFCFSEQIFYRKQSLGRPCATASLRESLLVDYNLYDGMMEQGSATKLTVVPIYELVLKFSILYFLNLKLTFLMSFITRS